MMGVGVSVLSRAILRDDYELKIAQCDEGNPCTRCLNILGKARTFLELCWRDDLGNICLVRQGEDTLHK